MTFATFFHVEFVTYIFALIIRVDIHSFESLNNSLLLKIDRS